MKYEYNFCMQENLQGLTLYRTEDQKSNDLDGLEELK